MSKNKSTYYIIKIMVLTLFIFILAGLNFAVYNKNNIKQQGEIVYLALKPVDPRSLMQGDYMALAYELELKVKKQEPSYFKNNYMIIDLDDHKIAQFNRVITEKKSILLTPNQKIIKIKITHDHIKIRPDSFFFQEGHGEQYNKAKYGIFKFKGTDTYILDGLADENRNRLGHGN